MTNLILPAQYVKDKPLKINITEHQGKVLIQLARPAQEIGFTPQQALQAADMFTRIVNHLMTKGIHQ